MFATHICYSELLDILRLVLMEPPNDYCLSSDRFADQGMEVVPGEKSNSEWWVLNDWYILHKNRSFKNGNVVVMNFLDRITDEAFRELVSFELPSIVSVFLNTCFCSLFDSMYSYSYMYIIQDAYRDEIIFMGLR